MGQYQVGTVDLTNGSPAVTGIDTEWLANASIGDGFKVEGFNAVFQVATVVSDTQITLSVNWPYASLLAQNYQIHRDFTPNMNLPEIWVGDKDWPYHLTVALRMLDSLVETSRNANLAGPAPPGINDDELVGYEVGSMWIDISANPKQVYYCVDATAGAAVWVNTSADSLINYTPVNYTRDSDQEGLLNQHLAGIDAQLWIMRPLKSPSISEDMQISKSDQLTDYQTANEATQAEASNEINLSMLCDKTDAQVETYVENNVTDLASAKAFLKLWSRIVLAIIKRLDLDD
jgi:hypothetical protein